MLSFDPPRCLRASVCAHRFCVHPNYFSDNPIGTSCTLRILGNNCSKDLKNVRAVQWCFVEAKGHCIVLVNTFRKFAAFIQVNRSELSDGDRERHNELTTAESLVRWIEWASIAAAITVTFTLVCWSRWIWSRESKRESHWNHHGWIGFTVCLINCVLSWTAQKVISCLPPFANVSWAEVPFLSWSDSQTGHVQMGPFSCNSGDPCMRTALHLYFCYPNFCGSVAVHAVASLWIARMVGIGILKAFLLCPDSHARPCQLLGKLAGWTGRAEKFSSMGIFKVCWWHCTFFEWCLYMFHGVEGQQCLATQCVLERKLVNGIVGACLSPSFMTPGQSQSGESSLDCSEQGESMDSRTLYK